MRALRLLVLFAAAVCLTPSLLYADEPPPVPRAAPLPSREGLPQSPAPQAPPLSPQDKACLGGLDDGPPQQVLLPCQQAVAALTAEPQLRDSPERADALVRLAHVYHRLGNTARVKELHAEAERIFLQVYKKWIHFPDLDMGDIANYIEVNLQFTQEDFDNGPSRLRLRALYELIYQPDLHREVDEMMEATKKLLADGEWPRARKKIKAALEIEQVLYGSGDPRLATRLLLIAKLYTKQAFADSIPGKVENYYLQALRIQQKAFPGKDPRVAATLYELGRFYIDLKRKKAALLVLVRAKSIYEATPAVAAMHAVALACVLSALGDYARIAGRPDEALTNYRRALPSLAVASERTVELVLTHKGMAQAYHERGELAEATQALEAALALVRTRLDLKTEGALFAQVLQERVELYRSVGDYDKALDLQLEALAYFEKTSGPQTHATTGAALELAAAYRDVGAFDQAIVYYEKAYKNFIAGASFSKTGEVDALKVIGPLITLYYQRGFYAKAADLYERKIDAVNKTPLKGILDENLAADMGELARRSGDLQRAHQAFSARFKGLSQGGKPLKDQDRVVQEAALDLAGVERERQNFAVAAALYRQLLAVPAPLVRNAALQGLATVLREQKKYAAAAGEYRKALAGYEQSVGPTHPLVADVLFDLAQLHAEQTHKDRQAQAQAQTLMMRALRIKEAALGPQHLDLAAALSTVAALHARLLLPDLATSYERRALDLRRVLLGEQHPAVADSLHRLAGYAFAQNRFAVARPLLTRALEVRRAALGPTHSRVAALEHDLELLRCVETPSAASARPARCGAFMD